MTGVPRLEPGNEKEDSSGGTRGSAPTESADVPPSKSDYPSCALLVQ